MLSVIPLTEDDFVEHVREYLTPVSLVHGLIVRRLFPDEDKAKKILRHSERTNSNN